MLTRFFARPTRVRLSRVRPLIAALVLTAAAPAAALAAQADGANDPSFHPADDGVRGYGPNRAVRALLLQPDQRAVAGGAFTRFNGLAFGGLVRVLPGGAPDPTFQIGEGAKGGVWNALDSAGEVFALAQQPDGKLIVGGLFTSFGGVPRNALVRLAPDGSVDLGFEAALDNFAAGQGGPALGFVRALALQPDGKLLVGGTFPGVDGVERPNLARLLANGDLDPTYFTFGPGPNFGVKALALHSSGFAYAAGDFGSFDGAIVNRMVRVTPDGFRDPNYVAPFNALFPEALAVRPDLSVLVAGVTSSAWNPSLGPASLQRQVSSGAIDAGFGPGPGPLEARALVQQPDGKWVVAGWFGAGPGAPATNIARLDANGVPDLGFTARAGGIEPAQAVGLQQDGRILLAGAQPRYDGRGPKFLTRIEASGALDGSYNLGRGVDGRAWSVVEQPDGKLLLGGEFAQVDGELRRGVARVLSSGELDASFDPGEGADAVVLGVALAPDGDVYIGGEFEHVDGQQRRRIARLNADGSLDTSFDPGASVSGGDAVVQALVAQPDGRVVIAGDFLAFGAAPRSRVARLHQDGTLDASFDPGIGPDGHVLALALQPDGKVLIAGAFQRVDNLLQRRVARLNADGSRDLSFTPGTGVHGPGSPIVWSMALQPDGKILLGGRFQSFNGVTRRQLVRLHSSGVLDLAFDPGFGPDGLVLALAPQPDGRVLIGGEFLNYAGVSAVHVARVGVDGSLDTSFQGAAEAGAPISALRLRADGRAVLAGGFTSYAGAPRHGLARIRAFTPAPASYCTSPVTSSGCQPSVQASGAPSASAAAGFTLQAVNLEGQRSGLFFYGVNGRSLKPWAPGSSSVLCVKAPTQRMSVRTSGGSAGQCDGQFAEDWLAWTAAHPTALGQPFLAGQAVHAQGWFRDPPAPKSTHLTNALEFTLLP